MARFIPRLYITEDLQADQQLWLSDEQAHYLGTVLRLKIGQEIFLFNGRDGEWIAKIERQDKRTTTAHVISKKRPQIASPEIILLFAPIKSNRQDFLIEKATELGVTKLSPVVTEYCQVRQFNVERTQRQIIEASQQCERLTLPQINPMEPLIQALEKWPSNLPLFAGEGRESARSLFQELATQGITNKKPLAILVGPEGGFSPPELKHLESLPFILPASLGPNILRAETAAIAALSICQNWLISDSC